MNRLRLFLMAILFSCTCASAASPSKIRTLYNSLDPKSVSQNLAFYELYSGSPEGKAALNRAWMLLSNGASIDQWDLKSLSSLPAGVNAIVALVNRQPNQQIPPLSSQELEIINRLAKCLPNRQLLGNKAKSEEDVLRLQPDQVDLARGLFLSQMGENPELNKTCSTYEALIDLMALQILPRLGLNASPEEKIRAINIFIFEEMGFRFPPHSEYADVIDTYTFLSSVLDSRRGVCLGVSILYIAIAQRLNLSLEMITPPGHIYVRYPGRVEGDEINIETTARGIHIDSDEYLGIETRSLQKRNVKEVIGLAHFNQASTHWSQGNYAMALTAYKRAQKYLPDDMLLKELLGYQYILTGQEEEGRKLLQEVRDYLPDYAISRDTTVADYLEGATDAEGIKVIYMHVDETRESLLKKKVALEQVLSKYPRFRSGIVSLGVVWLQLHRQGEALKILEEYHSLDSTDPAAEYYLTVLHALRLDYNKAWQHFHNLDKILKERNHQPKLIKKLKKELVCLFPS